ncbi:hypothetical protein BGW42_001697 [Actinomortierella wolfii]|nr:hypothetical protein BGW42_001697 [Actinomortierella wolfii]
MAIPPYSDESTPTSTTTMSEAANEVNAALVAAVTAGEGTGAFTSSMDIDNIEVDKETLESIVAGNAPRLGKRPAEDDEEELESDSVKLRKLQEEVNNNANAAAQASGILTSTSLSTHTSNHSSPVHSASGVETHAPEGGHNDATDDHDTASHGSHQDSPVAALPETTRLTLDKSQVEAALAAVAAAHPGLETSHQIMADLARIQQIAKIDPTQLASYSTNPNNQATLEQLTSSALANVLAQAPIENLNLHLSQQPAREGDQQAQSQSPAAHGILASIPTSSPSTTADSITVTAGTTASTPTTTTTAQPQPSSAQQATSQATSQDQPDNQSAAHQDDSASSHDEETIASKRAASKNMTNEERRQRRLLRNRMAAKECRKKKKAYVQELEDTVQRLKEENVRLHKEVEELNAKLTLGAMRIDENYRLIREVEKLNAKLTLGMAGADAHVHEGVGQPQPQHSEEEEDQAEQAAVAAAAAAHHDTSAADTPVTQADGSPNAPTEAAETAASAAQPAMAEFITA